MCVIFGHSLCKKCLFFELKKAVVSECQLKKYCSLLKKKLGLVWPKKMHTKTFPGPGL